MHFLSNACKMYTWNVLEQSRKNISETNNSNDTVASLLRIYKQKKNYETSQKTIKLIYDIVYVNL